MRLSCKSQPPRTALSNRGKLTFDARHASSESVLPGFHMCVMRSAVVVVLCLATLCAGAGVAEAQSRVGAQVGGGVAAPLSTSHRLHASLPVGSDAAVPQLTDLFNNPALSIGAAFLLSSLEVRYAYQSFRFSSERQRCMGDIAASRRPDGEVDDAEVSYDCDISRDRISLTNVLRAPLRLHFITVGTRFYARRPAQPRLYGVAAAGIVLSNAPLNPEQRRIRFGFNVAAGGGVDFHLDRGVALFLDARYRLSVFGKPSSSSLSAGRALAADRRVIAAVVNTFHTFDVTAGIRVYFR